MPGPILLISIGRAIGRARSGSRGQFKNAAYRCAVSGTCAFNLRDFCYHHRRGLCQKEQRTTNCFGGGLLGWAVYRVPGWLFRRDIY